MVSPGSTDTLVVANLPIATKIDSAYADGVSLTHGNLRRHIWSFAARLDEVGTGPHASGKMMLEKLLQTSIH